MYVSLWGDGGGTVGGLGEVFGGRVWERETNERPMCVWPKYIGRLFKHAKAKGAASVGQWIARAY